MDALREVLARPVPLGASEMERFEQLRVSGAFKRPPGSEVYVTEQAGKPVFRQGAKKWQRGTTDHPLTIAGLKAEREFLSAQVKAVRRPPVEAASRARTARSLKPKVERLLRKYGPTLRPTCARVAKELGLSSSYVRQIRDQMTLTEGSYRED